VSLTVKGPALELRFATAGDAPALFALGRDPAVTRFFSWGPYEREEQAREWIEGLPGLREQGVLLDFVIVRRDSGELLGVTGLAELSARDRRSVVGSWLGHRHWGSGVNFEAKALITALAFDELGMERLSAYAATLNGRSQAALERVGFRPEGTLRAWHRHEGEPRDVEMYALHKKAWERSALGRVKTKIEGDPPEVWVTS
jgi:ribosomal-protein-alanine N-acetyltransferase